KSQRRVCGPNCHGTINILKGIPVGYDYSVRSTTNPLGRLRLLLIAAPSRCAGSARALSRSGNQLFGEQRKRMDLDLCDFVEFFLEDETTKVCCRPHGGT